MSRLPRLTSNLDVQNWSNQRWATHLCTWHVWKKDVRPHTCSIKSCGQQRIIFCQQPFSQTSDDLRHSPPTIAKRVFSPFPSSLSIFPFPKQEEDHKKNRLGFHSNSNNLLSTYKSRSDISLSFLCFSWMFLPFIHPSVISDGFLAVIMLPSVLFDCISSPGLNSAWLDDWVIFVCSF